MAADQTRVLVVDDEEPIRRVLARLLEKHKYETQTAASAEEALKYLEEDTYALVLTDMDMPGQSGLDLIMRILSEYPDTATVMVTGLDDAQLATTALEIGAYGYIIKPFEPNEILISASNALRRRRLEIENRNHRQRLEEMVRERTAELWDAIGQLEQAEQELRLSREETIHRLVLAAEFRDDETVYHIERMSRYCGLIASRLGWDEERSELIRVASLMHDVGKIGTPDSILLKPGPLTAEERATMQEHAEIGYRILDGSESELLRLAAQIAYTHHERVDGTGYPLRLKGDEIPLEGRIAATADVFDALTSARVYKRAFPLGRAIEIMKEGRGTHFDARILDVFLDAMDQVVQISEAYSDPS